MMVKFPCGAGGTITEFPSGKENTYKLADCTFLDNAKGKQEVLQPAAHWAASISLNAPKLGKGNWWLPSSAEIVEIMRDITYGTSLEKTNPDIINSVLNKLTSISNSGWSKFSASYNRWTSSMYDGTCADFYYALGSLCGGLFPNFFLVAPITIYEFQLKNFFLPSMLLDVTRCGLDVSSLHRDTSMDKYIASNFVFSRVFETLRALLAAKHKKS